MSPGTNAPERLRSTETEQAAPMRSYLWTRSRDAHFKKPLVTHRVPSVRQSLWPAARVHPPIARAPGRPSE
ncbi:hypothetical protein FMEAI12_3640128 [Parafrankia sp. Ea1.12]|nr:hypothetical protein FMEAI12_3640128 [Parafrankia sp. Ea1.12]